ncbi:MAG: MFS transporter [Planctomycetia bacterium]|nr:MFS transporter [Planctomycetia bacterium]
MASDPSASTSPAAGPPRSALLVIFLTVFIDLLGFGIVLPVMPRQAEPYLTALDLSPVAGGVVIGLLFSVFSLMQFLFSPLWGRLSDRVGRRPMLILSLAGSVVFYALYGYAVTVPTDPVPSREMAAVAIGLMLLARIGAGIAGASVGTAAAVIADCTTPENRARGMALIGIAFGAGFTLGPLIAYFGLALFASQPWGVGALASLLSFVALVIAVAVFRETRRSDSRAAKDFFSLSRTAGVLALPAVGALVLVYFLSIFAFANFEATLARFTKEGFGMTDDDNFLVFAAIGAVLMVAGGLYRPLAKRLPETRLLAGGLGVLIMGLAAIGIVAWLVHRDLVGGVAASPALRWLFYAASAAAVAGFAFVNPSVSALISKRSDPARQGEVLGVNQSFASLGRILGPFAGSLLFAVHPSRTLPYAVAVATLLFVATLLPRISAGEGRP